MGYKDSPFFNINCTHEKKLIKYLANDKKIDYK